MPRTIADFRLYAAITSQPRELERLLAAPESVEAAAERLAAATRVFTIGIGTSTNAAQTGAALLRGAGLDVQAWSSADFALYPPALRQGDAAVVYTHSGAKQYTLRSLEALRAHQVPTVLLTSSESAIGEGDVPAGAVVLRTTSREQTSMFTVSHTAAMLLSARVADAIRPGSVGDLTAVPPSVREALRLEPATEDLARAWFDRRALVALGGGPHEVSAHETAIKVAEAARRAVRGHAVEQFLHGLQVQVQSDEAFLVFAGDGPALDRTRQAARFVLALDCAVAWVAPIEGPDGATWLRVPDVGEALAPIVEIVPAQLLAGQFAALADIDGDVFRADEPVFKGARDALTL